MMALSAQLSVVIDQNSFVFWCAEAKPEPVAHCAKNPARQPGSKCASTYLSAGNGAAECSNVTRGRALLRAIANLPSDLQLHEAAPPRVPAHFSDPSGCVTRNISSGGMGTQ